MNEVIIDQIKVLYTFIQNDDCEDPDDVKLRNDSLEACNTLVEYFETTEG